MSLKLLALLVSMPALATLYCYVVGERSGLFWLVSLLTFSFVGLALFA